MGPLTSIEIDPETAAVLWAHASASGLTIQEYLKKHFAAGNGVTRIKDPDQWLDELVEGLPNLPPLPNDFSTRDIYTDHD
jgi:hypothetical protein